MPLPGCAQGVAFEVMAHAGTWPSTGALGLLKSPPGGDQPDQIPGVHLDDGPTRTDRRGRGFVETIEGLVA